MANEITLHDFMDTFSVLHVASNETEKKRSDDVLHVYWMLSTDDIDKLNATSIDLFNHELWMLTNDDGVIDDNYMWMWENVLDELYAREEERCMVCGEINHVIWDKENKRYIKR